MKNKYDQQNIVTMEMIYGEGYLSAGGDSEVASIVDGIYLAGKDVLDIGCGLGGASITMARDHRVRHVTGIDIDRSVLDRAATLVKKAELEVIITLKQVNPGLLPLDDDQFDLAYITAVTCHLQELKPFFEEVFRVLKPGGMIVGCEWFKVEDNKAFQTWDELLRDRGLNFYFVDSNRFASTLSECGFEDVSISDRTAVIAALARNAVDRVDNELKDDLLQALGEDGYQTCRHWTAVRADALVTGGMGQGHFRGTRRTTCN
jgi:phosphoethanolamine N-methyltransferase